MAEAQRRAAEDKRRKYEFRVSCSKQATKILQKVTLQDPNRQNTIIVLTDVDVRFYGYSMIIPVGFKASRYWFGNIVNVTSGGSGLPAVLMIGSTNRQEWAPIPFWDFQAARQFEPNLSAAVKDWKAQFSDIGTQRIEAGFSDLKPDDLLTVTKRDPLCAERLQ